MFESNPQPKLLNKCFTRNCSEQVDLVQTFAWRCPECTALLQTTTMRIDDLSSRGLRYAKSTLHADLDLDRVM